MSNLNIQICPETGICSIVKGSTNKLDLMPGEVIALKNTPNDQDSIRDALAEFNPSFVAALEPDEIHQIKNALTV